MKVYEPALLAEAPDGVQVASRCARQGAAGPAANHPGRAARTAPAAALRRRVPGQHKTEPKHKAIDMAPQPPLRDAERAATGTSSSELPELDRTLVEPGTIKGSQLLRAAVRVLGRLRRLRRDALPEAADPAFGDRLLVANATGCSSIYGGNLPTTPWSDERGRARAGLGELAVRGQRRVRARDCVSASTSNGDAGARSCSSSSPRARRRARRRDPDGGRSRTRPASAAQRERVAELKARLAGRDGPARAGELRAARRLPWSSKSVWIVGGDGWAYDIGFGGLDHVLASGRNVNVLVLDTEVYSNTGGQASKATPRGAVAKFAAAGKRDAQEGPRPDGDGLRQRLRRPGRHGRQRRADAARRSCEAEAYQGRR